MSSESLRARLEAATPGPWDFDRDTDCLIILGYDNRSVEDDERLIAHAPVDLRLALDVIEAIDTWERLQNRIYLADGSEREEWMTKATNAWRDYQHAMNAFEAAP